MLLSSSALYEIDKINTSTKSSCSALIPAQKSRGNSVLGVEFSHMMPKMEVSKYRNAHFNSHVLMTKHPLPQSNY